MKLEPSKNEYWIEYETSAFGGIKDGKVKWISKRFYRCSYCFKGTVIKSNFCPNCGAKMSDDNRMELK